MNQLCYWDGQLLPERDLSVSVLDTGFVQGVIVSEQLRTFRGELFQLDQHMARLNRSLQIIGVEGLDLAALRENTVKLSGNNHRLLDPDDDLGVTLFVTPGPPAESGVPGAGRPTAGMFTRRIPFERWADKYTVGESLVVSKFHQVPGNCWPTELKCRSRMHYFLADREARQKQPGARALLLDQEGFISEASTAAVVLYLQNEGFVAPPPEKVLPSVSVGVLKTLAPELGIRFSHRDATLEEARSADEVFLISTSPCLLPVVSIDDVKIGDGGPGDVFRKTMAAWNSHVGIDIIGQAARFALD